MNKRMDGRMNGPDNYNDQKHRPTVNLVQKVKREIDPNNPQQAHPQVIEGQGP